MVGHCMGAASALEAVSCVETILTGIYPPTIHHEELDPECDVEVVRNQARAGKADVVLNNALAFGGYDAVVTFAKPGVLPVPVGAARCRELLMDPLAITGLSVVSPVGVGREAFFAALADPQAAKTRAFSAPQRAHRRSASSVPAWPR